MDSCHTSGHIKPKFNEGGFLFTVAKGSHRVPLAVADCPLRPSLAGLWWLRQSESCVVEVCWGPHEGRPYHLVGLGKNRDSELERAGDVVVAENLSSGPFSPDQMSTPHARVYIASGNKLWGNLILLEMAGWLSSHSGSPVASHQATVSPLLGGAHYLFNSAKPSIPHLLPPSVKPVHQLSGFTDAAGKTLWRQSCRRCMKQKEDRLTWAAPWTWCVWNALPKERRTSGLLRGGHHYFWHSSHLYMQHNLFLCNVAV